MDTRTSRLRPTTGPELASRRHALRLLAGGAMAAIAASGWRGSEASAKRKRKSGKTRGVRAGVQTEAVTCSPRPAADPCNCVHYVRNQTGLCGGPATAAGYTESVMRSKGYVRVSPRAGAIMVWDANRKGAGSAGHMAIVTGAYYNTQTRKWVIGVRHANWGGCGIRNTTFTGSNASADWGNLYGVNFYVPQ